MAVPGSLGASLRAGAFVLVIVAAPARAWDYVEVVDDLRGTTSHVLQLQSSVPVEGTDLEQHYPIMQLRCDEDGGQAYWRIHWFAVVYEAYSLNTAVGVVADIAMRVVIDDAEDRRQLWNWTVEDGMEGIMTYRARPIVRALEGAGELKLHIEGAFGKVHDAAFDVSGLDRALEQLLTHCRYP